MFIGIREQVEQLIQEILWFHIIQRLSFSLAPFIFLLASIQILLVLYPTRHYYYFVLHYLFRFTHILHLHFFFFFSTFFYSFDHLVSFSFFPSELPLEFLFLFFFSFLYFFSFWGCTHGIWKFPGQGSNWSYSCWAYVIAHGSPRSLSH